MAIRAIFLMPIKISGTSDPILAAKPLEYRRAEGAFYISTDRTMYRVFLFYS
jgi:hypothetical protein